MATDFGAIADSLGGFVSILVWIIIVGAIFMAALAGYLSGILAWRDHLVHVWTKRANGTVEYKKAMGRMLKGGRFEVYYGPNKKYEMEAPGQEMIHPNKEVHLFRVSEDAHFPLARFNIEENIITADPSWTNASKLALAAELKKNSDRFANNPWLQYAPYMAIIVGFIIVGIAWYISTGTISDKLGEVAQGFSGVAESLKDAKVIIEHPEAPAG